MRRWVQSLIGTVVFGHSPGTGNVVLRPNRLHYRRCDDLSINIHVYLVSGDMSEIPRSIYQQVRRGGILVRHTVEGSIAHTTRTSYL